MPVTYLRLSFLGLAVWGAVHPIWHYTRFMRETGSGFAGLIEAWYVNASTTGLAWDLTIAAVALALWIAVEAGGRRDWAGLVAIPVIFGVGLSCALPLYLFLRSREGA